MNYRTTYDTKHMPSSTKKNVKELNAAAKVKEDAQTKAGPSGAKKGTSLTAVLNEDPESGSDSDEEPAGKGGDKEKKKKEWCVPFHIILFLFVKIYSRAVLT